MEKRTAMLVVALMVVSMCSSVVVALPPMGPPKAMVGQDQWTVGVGFSHGEVDLDTRGTGREDEGFGFFAPVSDKHEIENLTTNIILGSLGFGISDSWDVFVSVGAADAEDDITEELAGGAVGNRYTGFDSSYEIAYGFGSRATFWEDGDITWGGLFQILWQNPDGSVDLGAFTDPIARTGAFTLTGDAELDFWELQVAVGPTWEGDNFRVYGGPFLHIVDGDIDIDTAGVDAADAPWRVVSSGEVEEASRFGGYAGAQWLMSENTIANLEIQVTADAWAVGLGAVWKFE
ncbi:MAG: hypothetical protein ISS70_01920 [Phycisphaerae bacterium]|nr:hypothetical protein [Phycisphaerae bacterium]